MIVAPSAVAAIGSSMPGVWSDQPVCSAERVAHRPHRRAGSRPRRGRVARHAMEQRELGETASRGSCRPPRATSTIVAMPVETIIGRPRRASRSRNGRFVSSPEPTLNPGTSIASRRSAEASSNGVERNTMPRSRACCRSAAQASVGRASRCEHRPLVLPLVGRALVRGGRGGRRGEGVGHEGLELDGVRAGVGRGIDESVGDLGVAVVVDARLGDDEDTASGGTDLAAGEAERRDLARPEQRRRDREVGRLVDVDRAFRRRRVAQRHARLDEPAAAAERRLASST